MSSTDVSQEVCLIPGLNDISFFFYFLLFFLLKDNPKTHEIVFIMKYCFHYKNTFANLLVVYFSFFLIQCRSNKDKNKY